MTRGFVSTTRIRLVRVLGGVRACCSPERLQERPQLIKHLPKIVHPIFGHGEYDLIARRLGDYADPCDGLAILAFLELELGPHD